MVLDRAPHAASTLGMSTYLRAIAVVFAVCVAGRAAAGEARCRTIPGGKISCVAVDCESDGTLPLRVGCDLREAVCELRKGGTCRVAVKNCDSTGRHCTREPHHSRPWSDVEADVAALLTRDVR